MRDYNNELEALKETIPKQFTKLLSGWSNLKTKTKSLLVFNNRLDTELDLIEKKRIMLEHLKEKELNEANLVAAFIQIIESQLKDFIIDNSNPDIFRKISLNFSQTILGHKEKIKEKFKEELSRLLKGFITTIEGDFVQIKKFIILETGNINEIGIIAIIKNIKKEDIKQIINIGVNHEYLLINQAHSNETFLVSLNSSIQTYIENHKTQLKYDDNNVEIVKGSSENLSIIIEHTKLKVYQCADKNGTPKITKNLKCYDKQKRNKNH